MHVRIETRLALTQKKLSTPPQGGLGGYLLCGDDVCGMWDVCGMMFVGCVAMAFFDTTVGPRPNLARMCG